jgi:hypothetical protein
MSSSTELLLLWKVASVIKYVAALTQFYHSKLIFSSVQCHSVWDQVLMVLQTMFEVIGQPFGPLLTKVPSVVTLLFSLIKFELSFSACCRWLI